MSFLFKDYSQKSYILIRCYKARLVLWNTNNNDRNGVNKQNTHTHTQQTLKERSITLERVSIKISDNLLLVESPILPIPPFLWKKSERLLFLKYFENSNLSLYKWEVPTMVICTGLSDRIKLSKSKRCIGSFLRYFCSNCRYWLLQSF